MKNKILKKKFVKKKFAEKFKNEKNLVKKILTNLENKKIFLSRKN